MAAVCLALFSTLASADSTLVQHDFDDNVLASGPDTFQVFISQQSKAAITSRYAANGYASAHLADVPSDRDFVEFQGYFPIQQSGNVRISFSFMITTTDNAFNAALVGKKRYQLHPHGINFHLLYRNGWLRHKSNGIPKKLFQPQVLQWYHLSAILNLDTGFYDLRIDDESGNRMIEIQDQAFAPGPADQYSLKEFSFTGDLSDRQPTDLYIDALHITSSSDTEIADTIAPGRKQYFIEQWDDYHKKLQGGIRCLPARDLKDFAIDDERFFALVADNHLEALHRLTRPHAEPEAVEISQSSDLLDSIIAWRHACRALQDKQLPRAIEQIDKAIAYNPDAYIFQLSRIIINAAAKQDFYNAYYALTELEPHKNDIRGDIALAMIALHTHENEKINTDVADITATLSDNGLAKLRESGAQPLTEQYRSHLHHYMPDNWQTYLQWLVALEQRYYALLWQGRTLQAGELAANISKVFKNAGVAPGIWLERQADAQFFSGRYQAALPLYRKALLQRPHRDALLLKLADIYHVLGEPALEKTAREMIFRNFSRTGQ